MMMHNRKPVKRAVVVKRLDANAKPVEKKTVPKLEEYINNRDYVGAVTLLEYQRGTSEANALTLPWLAYAAFHLGDYHKALDTYQEMIKKGEEKKEDISMLHLYVACCHFYLGQYTEAEEAAKKGPANKLQNRLLLHLQQARKDDSDQTEMMKYHKRITDSTEDQLSLASIHYLRSHFQEATDIYKRLLLEYRDYTALRVYVALCYYKLDYYDVSLEMLATYLQQYKDSAIAINLKACNHYKLYDGKAAEAELKTMTDQLQASSHNMDNNLFKHNLVVFRNGENALQVWPDLVGIVPEARLNLVIYYLRNHQIEEAFDMLRDLEPNTPQEYILKGVVNAAYGQLIDSRENIKLAQQYFQLVGASASECDTIPGRQCMASCFFLLKQFDDVLIYLNSVKAYAFNDPIFNYNHGLALAATEQFREAEEALLLVQDERIRNEYSYLSWLARCFIMNGKARDAWELYLKLESNTDSFAMLVLIANDCYKVGAFYYSAKAFDVLERLDPSPEYWEGKRGACCGVFQQVIARRERKECLRDVIMMLRGSHSTTPQAEFMVRIMMKWAAENGITVSPMQQLQ